MEITNCKLNMLRSIQLDKFTDFRGDYLETYNCELFKENGIDIDFVQDDVSYSKKDVLRGIHGDYTTWKMISCLLGEFYIVLVDHNESSSTYKKWEGFYLKERSNQLILVPPGFGVAHLALSNEILFNYKQSTYYNREIQFTLAWNDPDLKIKWPCNNPILSKRDSISN